MLDLAKATASDKFTSLLHAYIPQASNWAPDTSVGKVCTSVLFINNERINYGTNNNDYNIRIMRLMMSLLATF